MEFNDGIAEWMRPVNLEHDSTRQRAIAEAASTLAASLSVAAVLPVVQVAFGVSADEGYQQLVSAIRTNDETFASAPTDLETHIAAAACVAAVLERTARVGAFAAHAVLSADFTGLTAPVPSLVDRAKWRLHQGSEQIRSRKPITLQPDGAFNTRRWAAFAEDGQPVYQEHVRPVVESLRTGLPALEKTITDLVNRTNARVRATDEELNLLWWAFAGSSLVAERPWSKVSNDGAAALLMGVEAHRLMEFQVEPTSLPSILRRLLGSRADKLVSIGGAVTGAQKLLDQPLPSAGHQLMPILSSASEMLSLNGRAVWKEAAAERWQVDATATTTCLHLASQMTRELLMAERLG